MGIRKSKEETFFIKGNVEDVLLKSQEALVRGNFTNVKMNSTINQVTGNYKKMTVWGELIVSVLPEGENVKINAKSTANIDNIFALFTSPNQKILNKFKNNL